jgi:alpha-mannosidase
MMNRFILITLILTYFTFAPKSSAESNPGSAILDNYLKIGAALSQDQHSEAVNHAKNMKTTVTESKSEKVKAELLPAIANLLTSKDLESARESYEQLSSKLSAIKGELPDGKESMASERFKSHKSLGWKRYGKLRGKELAMSNKVATRNARIATLFVGCVSNSVR